MGTPALDGGIDLLHDAGRFEEAAEEDQGIVPLQGGEGQVEGHVVLGVVAGEPTQFFFGFFETTFFRQIRSSRRRRPWVPGSGKAAYRGRFVSSATRASPVRARWRRR